MSWLINNYLFGYPTLRNRWVSVLIIFKDGDKLVLDKGFIFLGDLPLHYLGNYCNFTNFTVINDRLFYMYKNHTAKEIDPKTVYLHLKFGNAPFEISPTNIEYWNLFFSSPRNKIYSEISSNLNEERIKMINLTDKFPSKKRLRATNITHPLFKNKQIYGLNMDQVLFSSLDLSLI